MHLNDCKKQLRIDKIRAREALSEETRIQFSSEICRRITELPEYAAAKTIFAYKWVRGEVKLDALEEAAKSDGKRLVFPLCISKTEMAAVEPGTRLKECEMPRAEHIPEEGTEHYRESQENTLQQKVWKRSGAFGIMEPVIESGTVVEPAEIDLVICPCSAFDEECRRLGMGGGYYDRYLPLCSNAKVIAVAYEVQKAGAVPADVLDCPVDAVITEASCYTANGKQKT